MITYPRKCDDCTHIANNPANWHYHKRTHEDIPTGQLCDFGCGQLAQFRKTSGKCSCSKITQQCPGYKLRHSSRITEMWDDEKCDVRRIETARRAKMATPEQKQKQIEKQIATKREKRLALEPSYDRKYYNRAILYHSNKNYVLNKNAINPTNNPRGKTQYHLDHKVSKFVGFVLGIPVDIISAPENLEIIHYLNNTSKCHKCSMHPIKLLNIVDADAKLINEVKDKLHLVNHLLT